MATFSTLLQGASATDIQPILDLSNSVFGHDSSDASTATHHVRLDEWQRRLDDPLSIIAIATTASGPEGFIFAHPKHLHPESQGQDTTAALHIWLAGVSQSSRGGGLFHKLMAMIEAHARHKGVARMSVATYPAVFEKMYAILLKTGWVEVRSMGEGKVSLAKDVPAS